jgi:hypothetical protein
MHLCSGLPVSCRSHTQALSCAVKRHVYRNDKAGITRQRTRTGARSLRRCAYSQTGISAAREKKLRDAQARAAKLKSPVSSAKRFAHRAISPPDPFDAFDQSQYRFRHHGMLRPALAKCGRLLFAGPDASSEWERCSCHSFFDSCPSAVRHSARRRALRWVSDLRVASDACRG